MNTNIYDVADWKPVTPGVFLNMMGEAMLTVSEPVALENTVEQLTDGRLRLVISAEVKCVIDPSKSSVKPYLMQIMDPETGNSVCLMNTRYRLDVG